MVFGRTAWERGCLPRAAWIGRDEVPDGRSDEPEPPSDDEVRESAGQSAPSSATWGDLLAMFEGAQASGQSAPWDKFFAARADAPAPRMQIGRYEIIAPLGSGGFGLVYRAFDPTLRRPRALKIPRPEVLESPAKRQRFLSDAVALARLDHPNVVRVYDADLCGGICYIAMEICEGGSLADWLKGLPLDEAIPPRWAAELVEQIAGGVEHAHERGIYHRELKPGNILLTPAAKPVKLSSTPGRSPRAIPPGSAPKLVISGSPKS